MKIFGYSVEECLTFFMLVVVGYFIAKLFSQKCNGFSVGAQTTCDGISRLRCEKFHPGRCEWVNNKCTNKNTPAPAPTPAGKKNNGSVCNDNNDCISDYCNMNIKIKPNFNGMCDAKQECDNNQQEYPHCDTCINDNLQFPDCTECKNNDKLRPPNCTECKEGQYKYPECTELKDCNEIDSVYCIFNPFCEFKDNQCQPKIKHGLGKLCKYNNECQSGVCYNGKCSKCEDLPGKVVGTDKCKEHFDKCEYKSEFFGERKCVTKQ